MSERVVLVTGGSRGIGAATATKLLQRGCRVAVSYTTSSDLAEKIADTRPRQGLAVQYSLGDEQSASNAVEQIVGRWGQLDGLVTNAGVWAGGRISDLPPAEWDRVVSDNISGTARITRAALPYLVKSANNPSITIVSSVVGLMGHAGDTAYASAKAGLFGFSNSLAKEVARQGVRVNALAPGFVETDMTSHVGARTREAIASQILLRRFGHVDEIADAIVFLSEVATYCTGTTFTVDGGWSR